MLGIVRFFVGVAGGFAAAASKVLAIDAGQLAKFLDHGNVAATDELRVTIFVATPILMVLGGLIAWATSEDNRLKLLAIGCAAPALVAPWTTHPPANLVGALLSPMSVSLAYAQDTTPATDGTPTVVTGLKVLLGISAPQSQNYWVIVGSDVDPSKATAFADAINAAKPDLQAFVGNRQPDNPNYPVIVGGPSGYRPLSDAQVLLRKATNLNIVPGDAYLSSYPNRLPSPIH